MGAYFNLRTVKSKALESPLQRPLPYTGTVSLADPKLALRSGKLLARAFAESYADPAREAVARSFTTAVTDTYWRKIQEFHIAPFPLPGFFRSQSVAELPDTALILARTMGEAASTLEPLPAAYLISVTYTAMLPEETRSRLGAYYTPPPLAERLVALATSAGINWETCRILDPACGGGSFLSSVAVLLKNAVRGGPGDILAAIGRRLKGLELDPYSAWLSQVFLEATLMPLCHQAGKRLPVVVEVCDSLNAPEPKDPAAQFDLVIGNPPYGRVSLPADMRERYRRSLFGHANLYGLFTDLAIRLTKPGGIVAYVTPTSFLAGEYFKSLRSLMASVARPINIDFISVRKGVFEDALQETMLATYRKSGAQCPATVHFVAPTQEDALQIEQGGQFEVPMGGSLWLVPRSSHQTRLIAALRSFLHRLKDYGYEVSTGPLVWNRHKSQLAHKPGKGVFPLIWAEAVTADGRFQFRANKKNHLPYFKTKEVDEWLVTRRACVLLQRTTAKEQSRRLIAAELPQEFIQTHGAVVIENHLNMIRPIHEEPAVPPATLAALLNSPILDRAFRCISGSVAVSAYELESIPLPPPEALRPITRLIEEGASAKAHRACERLFGEGE